jgi:peptidoglycan hydrolase CwlO-like protein
MKSEKVLDSYLHKLKEELGKIQTELSLLTNQHTDINKLIVNTSEECRKAKSELTEYETNKLANKMYFIEQKKEQIEDLMKKKKANDDKKKEKLDTQILEIKSRNGELQTLIEKIETEMKERQKEIKQFESLKEAISEQNDKSKSVCNF